MKHLSDSPQGSAETQVRLPTPRALAKQQTRAKVLQAARTLFSEQGYEGATIRDIAAAAGMSTGAVFANFTDKSDLFREIMINDMLSLVHLMRQATAGAKTVEDGLQRIFMAGYAFYKAQMPLARASFTVSWSRDQGPSMRSIPPLQDVLDLISQQLNLGIERGELSQEAEVKLRTQMLFEAYLANYPEAIFGGWSLDALQARLRDQIRVILAGARRG
jgi:AcrR family transcriptional regulator